MVSTDKRNIITKSSLELFCESQLFNHDENSKKKIINDIIKTAIEIGLLIPDTNNECENKECYFINKQYLGRSFNETLIKKLWIENKFISVNQESIETQRLAIQKSISEEQKRISLDVFFT
jgi:hypothetical protein